LRRESLPSNTIKKLVKTCKMTEAKAEKLWDDAQNASKKEGLNDKDPEFYKYAMGYMKRAVGNKCRIKMGWNKYVSESWLIQNLEDLNNGY